MYLGVITPYILFQDMWIYKVTKGEHKQGRKQRPAKNPKEYIWEEDSTYKLRKKRKRK